MSRMRALLLTLSLLSVSPGRVFVLTEWSTETKVIEDFVPYWLSDEADENGDGICNLEDFILFIDK